MNYKCVSCGKDTDNFSMRGIFLICKQCIIASDKSNEQDIIDYMNEVENYIKTEGVLKISNKLYNILSGNIKKDHHISLNNDLFKDAIYKIYNKPFNIVEINEVIIKIREESIDIILE